MADIGRSTSAHVPERAVVYSKAHDELMNWAAWYSALDGLGTGSSVQPMFREYMAGYRESGAEHGGFDEDAAIVCDGLIATQCTGREFEVLMQHYVYQRGSREAAKSLSASGRPCTHTQYLGWLDQAVGRLDKVLELVGAFEDSTQALDSLNKKLAEPVPTNPIDQTNHAVDLLKLAVKVKEPLMKGLNRTVLTLKGKVDV